MTVKRERWCLRWIPQYLLKVLERLDGEEIRGVEVVGGPPQHECARPVAV